MKIFEYLGLFFTLVGLLYISIFSKEPSNLFSYTLIISGATMTLTSFAIRMVDRFKLKKKIAINKKCVV